MRTTDNAAIARWGSVRRRSEYDYAIFEYYRSAKIIETLEDARVPLQGRVLDAGGGPGGIALSLAEEVELVVGLDLDPRFRDSGTRLRVEKGIRNAVFIQGDGSRLPIKDERFDLVLSHSVIEHVAEAEAYFRECRRVLRPGGILYLSTSPHLSLAGAHLPRLPLPIPLHILLGRKLAFRIFCWLARHAPWALAEPRDANIFVVLAEQGLPITDSLLQKVTVRRVDAWIDGAGFRRLRQHHHLTGFFRTFLPVGLQRLLARTPWTQDIVIGHIECVLVKA